MYILDIPIMNIQEVRMFHSFNVLRSELLNISMSENHFSQKSFNFDVRKFESEQWQIELEANVIFGKNLQKFQQQKCFWFTLL
jgi:hypothetical protein